MRAFSACLAIGFCLLLSGCSSFPFFDKGVGDLAQRGDWGRDVDSPWGAREGARKRDVARSDSRSQLDPALRSNLNSFLHAGTAAMQKNAMADARIQFETALELDPDNPHALHMLGRISDMDGRYEDAEYHYLRALASGEDASLLSDLGYSYMQQGRLKDARERLSKALAIQPDHRMAKINMAAVYAWSGDSQRALAWLRQVGSEEVAVASLQDILKKRPPGLGGGETQLAEATASSQDDSPQNYQAMLHEMENARLTAQRKRWEEQQAEIQWQQARMAELYATDPNGGGIPPQQQPQSHHQSPPNRHVNPPTSMGPGQGNMNTMPPMPIDVGPGGAAPPAGSTWPPYQPNSTGPAPFYGPQTTPVPGTGAVVPPPWPHQQNTQGQQFQGNNTMPPQQPQQTVPMPRQPQFQTGNAFPTGQQLQPQQLGPASLNPGQPIPWPTGRQMPSGYGPANMQQPATVYPPPGSVQQQPPVQTIEQTAYWDQAGRQIQSADAAARAARMGMSAGPGSPFSMNSHGTSAMPSQNRNVDSAMPAQNGPVRAAPASGQSGQHDVWRPGQNGAPAGQANAPQGVAPATPTTAIPGQAPRSQAHQVPSPTWNYQQQQPSGRAGQWTQSTPLGQQWQNNGMLSSPTTQMQSPTSNPQFAGGHYYNAPDRSQIQQQEMLNLGR